MMKNNADVIRDIRKENSHYLKLYRDYLVQQGLKENKIELNLETLELYLNCYLCYYPPCPMVEGIDKVDYFFNSWYIKKAWFLTERDIHSKSNTIKKFYYWMMKKGLVDQDQYTKLAETIKRNKRKWLKSIKRYHQKLEAEALQLGFEAGDEDASYDEIMIDGLDF